MPVNIVKAAVAFLRAQPDVVAVLGSSSTFASWIFQYELYTTVEESQSTAAVLSQRGSWTVPNTYNTLRVPRLAVELYADPQRDSFNHVTVNDCVDKMLAAYEAIDAHLHNVSGDIALWDGVRVIKSTRLSEPDFFDVTDGDGMRSTPIFYGVGY